MRTLTNKWFKKNKLLPEIYLKEAEEIAIKLQAPRLGNEFCDSIKMNAMCITLERIGYDEDLTQIVQFSQPMRQECSEAILGCIRKKQEEKVVFFIPRNTEKYSALLHYLDRFDTAEGTFDGALISEFSNGKIAEIEDELVSMGIDMPSADEAVTGPDNKLEHLEMIMEAITALKSHYRMSEEKCEEFPKDKIKKCSLMKAFFRKNANLLSFSDEEQKIIAETIALMNRESGVGLEQLKELLAELGDEERKLMSKNYLREIRKFESMLANLVVACVFGKEKLGEDLEEIDIRQIDLLLEEAGLPDYGSMIKNLDLIDTAFKGYVISDIAGKLQPYIDAASQETKEDTDVLVEIAAMLEKVRGGEDAEKVLDEKLSQLLGMFADSQGKNDLADLLEALKIFKTPLIKKLAGLIATFEESYYSLILDENRRRERQKVLKAVAEDAIELKQLLTKDDKFTSAGAETFTAMYLCKRSVIPWPTK